MTRLKTYVSNPTERDPDGVYSYVALEHVEPSTGRLLPDAVLESKKAADAILHRPGDVRFGKLRPYLAKSLLMDDVGSGSGELLVLRPRTPDLEPKWLFYLTLSSLFVQWAIASSDGVKMPRTSWDDIGCFDVAIPTLDEQRRVVAHLDAVTSRIDQLVDEQRRLVSYLQERLDAARQVLILGSDGAGMPGWQRGRLKRFVRIARGRFTHRPRNDPALYDGPYPFIQTGDIASAENGTITTFTQSLNEKGLAASRLARKGTIVMAIAANIGDVARLGFDCCYPDSVVALEPGAALEADFLMELIAALKVELVGSSTLNTQLNINVDRIGDVVVSVPPIAAQRDLIDHLTLFRQRVSAVRQETAIQIALLREHRQALISAAVTDGPDYPARAA
jgi:type I restriction enzyme S subunit